MRGSNLQDLYVVVFKDDVEYTPLYKSESVYEFLIGDNGSYSLVIGRNVYARFIVDGIEVPSFLPAKLGASRANVTTANVPSGNRRDLVSKSNATCLNYNYVYLEDWPYFAFSFDKQITSANVIAYHNCIANATQFFSYASWFNLSVIDKSLPAWLEIDGFIVFVFNYQQQRKRRG